MSLFQKVESADLVARSSAFPDSSWLTWSKEFRDLLARHRRWAKELHPRLVFLSSTRDYAYTYTVSLRRLAPSRFGSDLQSLIDDLLTLDPGRQIFFMTGLSCKEEGWTIHSIFALLRALIARATRNPWSVMHAPLSSVGKNAGDFKLHADLYQPTVLFNVFEQLPDDGTGRTLLLPISRLFAATRSIEMPVRARRRVRELLTRPIRVDAYDEFYSLLHGRYHPWTRALESRLRAEQLSISLGRFEGYILHDRRWLHGRETPTGGVPRKRLHRIIYTPYCNANAATVARPSRSAVVSPPRPSRK